MEYQLLNCSPLCPDPRINNLILPKMALLLIVLLYLKPYSGSRSSVTTICIAESESPRGRFIYLQPITSEGF